MRIPLVVGNLFGHECHTCLCNHSCGQSYKAHMLKIYALRMHAQDNTVDDLHAWHWAV